MIRCVVYKDGNISNEAEFESREEIDVWLNNHISIGTFQFDDKIIPAVFNDKGEIISPETLKKATHDRYEIIDVTEEKLKQKEETDIRKLDSFLLDALYHNATGDSSKLDEYTAMLSVIKNKYKTPK